MHAYLQEQIRNRMTSKQLSIHALERKAGLKRSAVRNILQGLSKKPSAETLLSIAEALECSINDLVGPDYGGHLINAYIKTQNKNTYPWNEQLYSEAVKMTSKCIQERTLELKLDQVVNLVNETYKYSLNKNSEKIDKDFTKWLVGKY